MCMSEKTENYQPFFVVFRHYYDINQLEENRFFIALIIGFEWEEFDSKSFP